MKKKGKINSNEADFQRHYSRKFKLFGNNIRSKDGVIVITK